MVKSRIGILSRSLLGILVVGLVAAPAAFAQIHREAVVRDITPLVADTFRDRGDGVLWEGRVSEPGAFYIRLRFSQITSPAGAAYTVIVRKANGQAVARYPADQFAQGGSFYTDPLFTDEVKVQVQATAPVTGVSFRIDRILRQVEARGRLTPQSVVPDWWAPAELKPGTPALRVADAVAKLYVGEGFVCTGFLIAPAVLVTNYHCLEKSFAYQSTAANDVKQCGDIKFQFDFDRQSAPESSTRTPCTRVLDADKGLDLAVLTLDGLAIASSKSRRSVLVLSAKASGDQEEATVIHHPAGLAKKISLGCLTLRVQPDLIEHTCSTAGGSSGAPILGPDGTVIALHFRGAFPTDMTVAQIEDALAEGRVFRNQSKPMTILRDRLQRFVP